MSVMFTTSSTQWSLEVWVSHWPETT